jgi:hypothetical protein
MKDNKSQLKKKDSMEESNYLTEMKELPPEVQEEPKTSEVNKADKVREDKEKKPEKLVQGKDSQSKALEKTLPRQETKEVDNDEEVKEGRLPLSGKDIILGVVNLISLVLLIFILIKLPKLASELKKLRVEFILNQSNFTYESPDLGEARTKKETIEEYFVDESGVIAFVNDVEKLKSENLAVQSVSFANQTAIKDRTGNFGVPIIIDLSGSWEAIDQTLRRIDSLPYLKRAAKIDIARSEDESVITFKYGVFLYVDPSLGENR